MPEPLKLAIDGLKRFWFLKVSWSIVEWSLAVPPDRLFLLKESAVKLLFYQLKHPIGASNNVTAADSAKVLREESNSLFLCLAGCLNDKKKLKYSDDPHKIILP